MNDLVAVTLMLGVAAATTAADQATKSLVLGSRRAGVRRDRPALVGIRPTLNPKSGPARMSELEAVPISLLTTAMAIAVAVLGGDLGAIGAGLALGGMSGNLIDQRRRRATVDYLALRNGAVANLADLAIAAGTLLMIVALVR
jgi:lipoprotein signal peptidase